MDSNTAVHQEGEATTPYTAQETDHEVLNGATTLPEDSTPDVRVQYEREGHLCFGGLFDMRIGTISANITNVLVKILCIAFEISWGDHYPVGTAYVSLILSMIAIFAALYFEPLPAYLSAGAFAAIALLHTIGGAEWFAMVWDCFIVYPTVVMAYQMQKGVMTRENYQQREEYIAPEIRPYVEKLVF